MGGSLANSTDISYWLLRTEDKKPWVRTSEAGEGALEAPAGQGRYGCLWGPRSVSHPALAVGTHWCNDGRQGSRGEAGLPLLLAPAFLSCIGCHLFGGPGAESGQAGAPDQAVLPAKCKCRMMTREDKPHREITRWKTLVVSISPNTVAHVHSVGNTAPQRGAEVVRCPLSSLAHPAAPGPGLAGRWEVQPCTLFLCPPHPTHPRPIPTPAPPRFPRTSELGGSLGWGCIWRQ